MGRRSRVTRCLRLLRASHLTAFVVAYVLVFLIANVVLLRAYWQHRQRERAERRAWLLASPPRRPPPTDAWLGRLQNSVRGGGGSGGVFTCANFPPLRVRRRLGGGWTKEVLEAELDGVGVAVKTVNVEGHDMRECRAAGFNHTHCYHVTARKLYREVRLLHQLRHDNVVQLLGFCAAGGGSSGSVAAVVTELGEPLDLLRLLQASWEHRLRLALDAAALLHFLATSPLGPALLADLRLAQFVEVSGRLKLADLDDVQTGERRCRSDDECVLPAPAAASPRLSRCRLLRCQGYNSRRNQAVSAVRLFSPLLEPAVPPHLNGSVQALLDGYAAADHSAAHMYQQTQLLLTEFLRSGYGVTDPGSAEYERVSGSTLSGCDYGCTLSAEAGRCQLSVSGWREAAALCTADRRCEGFVMTPQRSWTGRTMTHFKTRIVTGEVQASPNSTLYIRQSGR